MKSCCIAVLTGCLLHIGSGAGFAGSVSDLPERESVYSPEHVAISQSADQIKPLPLSREALRHLLARSGIGVAPSQLLALQGLTRQQAVDHTVQGLQNEPDQPMPAWVDRALPHYYRRDSMSEDERQQFNMMRDAELAQLRQWWITEMLDTSSPQTERLVFFWHDLFATSYQSIGKRSRAMALQNRRFRELGTGSWDVLLKAMIRDPALLDFLDNNTNRRTSPNENLARELLELFTLGEGNYDEATVKAAARALTGMASSDTFNDAYQLRTWHHDRDEKTLFGKTARFDGDGLVDAILEQPAASRFMVRRFWQAFIADAEPPESWVETMAQRFRESGYDLTDLYSAVLSSAAFWAPEHRGALIKSPLDIVVGTARSLEYPKARWQSMATVLGNLEMDLFAPPNVAGWPKGQAFITPGRLLGRQYALDALVGADVAVKAGNSMDMDSGVDSEMASADQMAPGVIKRQRTLSVRVAAENYHGPAQMKVELDDGNTVTWASEPRTVQYGIDTLRFGRMQGIGMLPWHEMTFDVPFDAADKASSISITYLNDDGGEDGDRNLYIDGVTFRDRWIPAAGGNQTSSCPPEMNSEAGNLYCAGKLTMILPDVVPESVAADLPAYRSSSVQLRWASASEKKNRQSAMFILDHVITPSKTFDLVSFDVIAHDDGSINLNISSFACLPKCFEQFADCAWEDSLFPALKSMSFPLARRGSAEIEQGMSGTTEFDDEIWCGYDALPAPEQALVAVLWRSVPTLLELTRQSKRGLQFAKPLSILESRLGAYEVSVADSFWAQVPGENRDQPIELVIDADFAPPISEPVRVAAPLSVVGSLDELVAVLPTGQLSLEDVLLSGVGSAGFDSLSGLNELPAEQQLRRLMDHPVFQVR